MEYLKTPKGHFEINWPLMCGPSMMNYLEIRSQIFKKNLWTKNVFKCVLTYLVTLNMWNSKFISIFCTNISEEIRDLTANNVGQKLGTLGRHIRHWAEISRCWADIGQTLESSYKTLNCKIRLLGLLLGFLIQDETLWFSYPR